MAAKLIIAPEAEQDLGEAYAWYEEWRLGLGEEFLGCVDACIQAICRMPEIYKLQVVVYLIWLFLLVPTVLFSQQRENNVNVESSFKSFQQKIENQNRIIHQFDSTITKLRDENIYLTKLAENNITHADSLISALQTIVEFIALLIAIFSIVGLIEIMKINKIRTRLNEELQKLSAERQNAQSEIQNLKDTFLKDGRELLQILFFVTEGDNCVDSDRLEEAISFYKQALKIRENNPEVYTKLGYVFIRKGEYNQAISFLQKGCKLSPQNVSLLNGLARAYRKSHQFDKARDAYIEALEIDNEYIWALSGLGQIYLQKEDFDNAEIVYHKILSVDGSLHPNINLGIVYACKNDQEKAKYYFGQALSLIEARLLQSSKNKWSMPYKIVALAGLSRFEEAHELSLQIKTDNIYPPTMLSITDRLNVLYKGTKHDRIKKIIKIFDIHEPLIKLDEPNHRNV
jgi:Flp pilus assembly protein TadD